jgi:hypothetical protein
VKILTAIIVLTALLLWRRRRRYGVPKTSSFFIQWRRADEIRHSVIEYFQQTGLPPL